MDMTKFISPHIRELKPYSSARSLHKKGILLDANENPFPLFGDVNRYPDGSNSILRNAFARMCNLDARCCAAGNGSDELLDVLFKIFCTPGDDIIITSPTYGMYEVLAATFQVNIKDCPQINWQPDVDRICHSVTSRTKMIILCSPNNPTGMVCSPELVEQILRNCHCPVVIDEAYADFSSHSGWLSRVPEFPNLMVLRTLSKAFALAGARVGFLVACPEIIDTVQKVKLPYNISALAQKAALRALLQESTVKKGIDKLLISRKWLEIELSKIPEIDHVFPSDANFILFRIQDADRIFTEILEHGIVLRSRSHIPGLTNCLRVTVGTESENRFFIGCLKKICGHEVPLPSVDREAIVLRKTNETEVSVRLNLDGEGRSSIVTGIPFYDHMLEQLAKHSGMDVEVTVSGDLEIDEHHTVEDSAIALGDSLKKALGDKHGIERYGFLLPMDDVLVQCALDFSNRSWMIFEGTFTRTHVGAFPTEMLVHWLKSFSDACGMNLHVKILNGQNDHHKIEATFKALGRCLRQAIAKTGTSLPSTKGVL